MAPYAEIDPIIGTSIFAVIIAVVAKLNVVKKSKLVKEATGAVEAVEEVDRFQGMYHPGQPMPNRGPDEVTRYYLKNLTEDETFQETAVAIDAKDQDTPDQWVPRHKDLVRLTGRHPFNCEAPLKSLFNKGFITPTSLHYVRNHGACPNIKWENHVIKIGGLAPSPIELKMKDIMALPMHSLPVTLVCCGNRRKEQNMIKQTIGFNWGAAGVSTGVWSGARLIDILKLAGISGIDNFTEGHHIRFASESERGGDKLPGGVYGTSIPLEKALDRTQDVIVAYMYNGKLLTPDHGYPVRVIIPGYVGGRMIKWMTNIDLLATVSQDYYHFFDNRVMPPHVDAELAKSENWWYKPEYICNDLSINSAIAKPDHDEVLTVVPEATYTCGGYCYTGGGRRITRIEVSLNGGALWNLAQINITEKPSRSGKYWCWIMWEYTCTHEDLAKASEIVVRGWDEGHNTQPDKPTWNLMGMLNNPWFRVKIAKTVDPITQEVSLQFEHPTLAGNQNGGWMPKMREHPALTTPGVYVDPNTEVPSLVPSLVPILIEEAVSKTVFDPSKPHFSMEEVAQHTTHESAWFVVNDKVYDGTPFLKAHPGGAESILISAGMDSTEEFDAIHSKKAWKLLDEYYIGQLTPGGIKGDVSPTTITLPAAETPVADVSGGDLIALDPKKRIAFTLSERIVLSPDSLLLRFALQSPQHILGLPVGQHMLFSAKVNGKLVMRAYTPTSSDHDLGHFDLVIKIYFAGVSSQFPEGGKMSQHLGKMVVGDSIDVKGPLGHVTYVSRGVLKLGEDTHNVKKFTMLCGGTGITPIYQVLCAVLRDAKDTTEMSLIFANRTEADILLKDELDMLARGHPNRLTVHYILSKPADAQKWLEGGHGSCPATRSVGHLNKELVAQKCAPGGASTGAFALLCGPDGFLSQACDPALVAHGYTKEMCVYF